MHTTVDVDLRECVLIIPALSVGNVPQLTLDLWINSFKCQRIALCSSSHLTPVAGYGMYTGSDSTLGVAGEVYYDSEHQVALVQLRSPPVKNEVQLFVRDLQKWAEEKQFKEVVVLHSADVSVLESPEMRNQLRHISSSLGAASTLAARVAEVSRPLEFANASPHTTMREEVVTENSFTYFLLEHLKPLALFFFCSEGDNIVDSRVLFQYALKIVCGIEEEAKFDPPPSWQGLFV